MSTSGRALRSAARETAGENFRGDVEKPSSTNATATRRRAARLYAEAALKAPDLAERDYLTRQAARLNAGRRR